MNKNRLFKRVLLGLISLASVLAIAGCGFTPVAGIVIEKYETRVTRTIKPYTRKDCYRLVILDSNYDKHKRCVSERVYYDAMLDHHINLTEEYR